MEGKVLVAYGSKYGATAEIAKKIGEVLVQEGLQAEVADLKTVKDPAPYQAVVLGSAAYIGQWRKEAVKFVQDNQTILSGIPVWLFVSGPTGEGDPVEQMQGWLYPKKLQPAIDAIKPKDIAVFHGAIDTTKLNFLEKFAIKNVKAPLGDFRNWESITAWAKKIAATLK